MIGGTIESEVKIQDNINQGTVLWAITSKKNGPTPLSLQIVSTKQVKANLQYQSNNKNLDNMVVTK